MRQRGSSFVTILGALALMGVGLSLAPTLEAWLSVSQPGPAARPTVSHDSARPGELTATLTALRVSAEAAGQADSFRIKVGWLFRGLQAMFAHKFPSQAALADSMNLRLTASGDTTFATSWRYTSSRLGSVYAGTASQNVDIYQRQLGELYQTEWERSFNPFERTLFASMVTAITVTAQVNTTPAPAGTTVVRVPVPLDSIPLFVGDFLLNNIIQDGANPPWPSLVLFQANGCGTGPFTCRPTSVGEWARADSLAHIANNRPGALAIYQAIRAR